MDEQTRLKAREDLLRSRLYRFIALVFAAVGLALFVVLYMRFIDGNIEEAIRNPVHVLIILIPFLPAFVLSWMARRAEDRFMKVLDQLKDSMDDQSET